MFHVFTREEIRQTVSAEVNVEDYARRIYYSRLENALSEDPFDVIHNTPEHGDKESAVEQTELYNHLLYWLSAVGSGSLVTFQTACHTLGWSQNGTEPRRILRHLRLLGHLECSRDGTHWSVAPPVLTRRSHPPVEETYILCGGRDAILLECLRARTVIEEAPQPWGNGPAAVYIRGDGYHLVHNVTKPDPGFRLQVIDNTAERLASLLPPIEAWLEMLQVLTGITPHLFDVRRFDGSEFVDDAFDNKSGLYELWQPSKDKQSQSRPKYTLFYDADRGCWLRGDWYGLRYLASVLKGELCEVQYDQNMGCLAVPEGRRWPELYERILVLASGCLPVHRGGWLLYKAIGPSLVDALQPKLHLQL
jgi:hypothetical protein